jgi:hypothetical protein
MSLPDPIFRIDEAEREQRSWVGEDTAILRDGDAERFFVRALLELPIVEEDGYFGYGTWVEVSQEDFDALGSLWHDDEGWRSEPFAGSLANELLPYAFTEGLPVRIRLRDVELLPLVELDEIDHALLRAQRNGISSHRAHELAAALA